MSLDDSGTHIIDTPPPAPKTALRLSAFRTPDGRTIEAATLAAARKLAAGADVVLVRTYFKHSVRGGGPWWRLFREAARDDAPWHLYFEHRKQRHKLSLKTDSLELAKETARRDLTNFFEGHQAQFDAAHPRQGPQFATFAEVFALLPLFNLEANAVTRRGYVWGVRWVFALALELEPAAVDALSTRCLDAAHGDKFFAAARARAAAMPAQHEQNKFRRLVLSAWAMAKTLFAPEAMKSAALLGLQLPTTVDAWRKSKPASFKAPKDETFPLPDEATLRATFRQWIALARRPGYVLPGGAGNSRRKYEAQPLHETARRNMFLAVGLMISCGLRKNEVRQIRWRHLTTDPHGQPRLIAREINVKNKSAGLEVRPLDPFWRILQRTVDRHGWRGAPDAYVLAQRPKTPGDYRALQFSHGGHCDRTYWPFYHVGAWLRSLGWKMQKSNHALRDCAASYVTMKWGLDRAKLFARHSQLATTEAHYSNFVREDKMDNPKALAWLRWSK